MSGQLKANLYKLASVRVLRVVYVLAVLAAMALAAGAPIEWGGTGP
ncbi:MAG: hypothetical protein QME94_02425 [Anaerolineae bacterium]|nr:hypothetical protein [Anaerolineae bacterium]